MPISTASTGLSTAGTQAALAAGKAVADSNLSADQISAAIRRSTTPSAAGKLVKKLVNNAGDATVLVNSDSTGNETTEWVYLYAQALATLHPLYTVLYYLWDDVAEDYAAAETIQTGTGSYTLNVYNAANAGKAEAYMSGAKFAAGVRDIPLADLIIMNHGHNMTMGVTDITLIEQRKVTRFVASIAQMLSVHSGAGVLMIAQNPNRDDDTQLNTYQAVISAAGLLQAGVADVYSPYIVQNKANSLYLDDKHPSATGTQLFLDAVMQHHYSLVPQPAISPLDNVCNNLLGDAFDIIDSTGTLRSGWANTNATVTKDTNNVASAWGYSANLAGNGGRIAYTLDPELRAELVGRWITLAVRLRKDIGSPDTAGVVQLVAQSQQDNGTVATVQGEGGFKWEVISLYVTPAMASAYIQARLHADTGSNNGSASFDRAVLCVGRLPAYR